MRRSQRLPFASGCRWMTGRQTAARRRRRDPMPSRHSNRRRPALIRAGPTPATPLACAAAAREPSRARSRTHTHTRQRRPGQFESSEPFIHQPVEVAKSSAEDTEDTEETGSLQINGAKADARSAGDRASRGMDREATGTRNERAKGSWVWLNSFDVVVR